MVVIPLRPNLSNKYYVNVHYHDSVKCIKHSWLTLPLMFINVTFKIKQTFPVIFCENVDRFSVQTQLILSGYLSFM